MLRRDNIHGAKCHQSNPMKFTNIIRRHTLGTLIAICCFAATTGCVTVVEDDDGNRDKSDSSGGNTSDSGTSGGGTSGGGTDSSDVATCASFCATAVQCSQSSGTVDECVAFCQQQSWSQSVLDCIAIAAMSCDENAGNACLDGTSTPPPPAACSTADECPWHSCDCPDGTTPQARSCVNGTCLDAELACADVCL